MPSEMKRPELHSFLSAQILSHNLEHPIRVAIDGIDTSGKTTLANELAEALAQQERQVIRAGIDGFHNPPAIRKARGRFSAQGYYLDSFDHQSLITCLLAPLGPNGNLLYRTSVFSSRKEMPVYETDARSKADAILLFDGVFLFRPELDTFWDFRIFLQVSFDEALTRAVKRDLILFQDESELRYAYLNRYFAGHNLYCSTVSPQRKADVVIDNNDVSHPILLKSQMWDS
jgi:uridine kinase